LQKGLRSLEIKKFGLEGVTSDKEVILEKLRTPNAERIFYIGDAFRVGMPLEKIQRLTQIDPWFLHNIKEIIDLEKKIKAKKNNLSKELLHKAKEFSFSDLQLAKLIGKDAQEVYQLRRSLGIDPAFKLVDTCAAEFLAHTPYFYSTYDT
jgi:carbamoyl-phosphate synthase large subunit